MADRDVAIVTPSYGPDRERCRLLCDSIDARVRNLAHHYILVADHDVASFRAFAGSRRSVVAESDVLPERFACVRLGRPLWLSTFAPPLRGWHLQQLRRIALAAHVDHAALLYCDSDMAFSREFDTRALWRGERVRLYRNPKGIGEQLAGGGLEHMSWTTHAHRLLGLAPPRFPAHDYINNLVSWRREGVLAMLARIERVTERPWLRAIASRRAFSECQIYGAFADEVEQGDRTWRDETRLCLTRWGGSSMKRDELRAYMATMDERQVAIGIQSFTQTDPAVLRDVLGL